MAISLVIDKNPWTPQPINVNGDVMVMPHLGAVNLLGTVTGNLIICIDAPNASRVTHNNGSFTLGGSVIEQHCTQGGGGEQ